MICNRIGIRYTGIPSGKRLHNYGKSPCWMGKSTISMAIFNSKLFVYQRVYPINIPLNPYKIPLNHHKIPFVSHYQRVNLENPLVLLDDFPAGFLEPLGLHESSTHSASSQRSFPRQPKLVEDWGQTANSHSIGTAMVEEWWNDWGKHW